MGAALRLESKRVKLHWSTIVIFAAVSAFISACVVIANGYIAAGSGGSGWPIIHVFSPSQNSIVFGIVLGLVLFSMMCVLRKWDISRSAHADISSASLKRLTFRRVAIYSLVIFAFWLPCIVLMYPGIVWADTATQLYQFFGYEKIDLYTGGLASDDLPKISDHHPLFTTLIFSFFVWVGGSLFGSSSVGLFLFVLIQALLAAFSFGLLLGYLRSKLGLPSWVAVAGTCFFGLFPMFPIVFSSVAKDTLFVPFFTLFSILYCEAIKTRGASLADKRFACALIIVSILMVLCKKLGLYILAVCVLIMLFVMKERRIVPVVDLISCFLAVNVIVPVFLYPAFDAGAGSSKEMFSVPFQQTALYFRDHADDVSEYEYQVVDKVLVADSLPSRYFSYTADFVKNPAPGVDGNAFEYLKVYLSEGLRHPGTYARAFAGLEAGFVSTSYTMACQFDSVEYDYFKYGGMPDVYQRPAAFYSLAEGIEYSYLILSSIPVLNIALSQGLYVFILPATLLAALLARHKIRIAMLAPFFVSALFLFLSPISTGVQATRYVLPLLCLIPLLLGLSFCTTSELADEKMAADRATAQRPRQEGVHYRHRHR